MSIGLLALCVAAASLTLVAGQAASADTSPPAGQPATVSADPLPTVQIDGVVWAQVVVGNTVYVTGSFANARPAGTAANSTQRVARANLLAYNITTGALITTFNHSLNAQGRAITASPDGSRVYVAGDFTTVDGATHNRLAAFNTATGALVTTFNANLNNIGRAVTATNSTVYVGGSFNSANGITHNRLAAFTAAGALTGWTATADAAVFAMVMSPDQSRVVVAGGFNTLAGQPRIGIGAVAATDASSEPWSAGFPIKDSGSSSNVTTLSADATNVYGSAYYYTTGGNFEGRFAANPNTGDLVWMNSCHGDSYSAFPIGGVLYSASHEHDCSDIGSFSQNNLNVFSATHHYLEAEAIVPSGGKLRVPIYPGGGGLPGPKYFDFSGQPDTTQLNWYPTLTEGTYTASGQAAWSVTGNSSYLSVGGEFPTANGVAQQGLVRYAIKAIAPNKIGPEAIAAPTGTSQAAGSVRVSWRASWDQDNSDLTYNLYRDGGTAPIYTTTYSGAFFMRPMLGYVDAGLAPGSTHTYRVQVTDPSGNLRVSATSASISVGSATPGSYLSLVRADGASSLWPLAESGGATAFDAAGYTDLSVRSGITFGAAGPIPGQGTAATLSGVTISTPGPPPPPGFPAFPPTLTSNSVASSVGDVVPLSSYSLESWVKTTSTQGGALLSDSVLPADPDGGQSPDLDRVLYLGDDGKVSFGVFSNNAHHTVTSSGAVNDGAWHLISATVGSSGATLSVDGAQVAADASLTDSAVFFGHWRIGGDSLNGWTPRPTSNYLAGTVADVAVYPTVLTAGQISAHFAAAGGVVNLPPTAAFTSSCTNLDCSFNGTGSFDPEGSSLSYAWSFGDGSTATGSTATHTYTGSGSYPVTLTVTDAGGATGVVSHSVSVSAPGNAAPTAAFSSNCSVASCSFDGTGSGDPDGTISGYAWNFGDGSTATGPTTTHTYGGSGTFQVTLTVTDNGGATGTVQHAVVATVPTGGAFVTDTFNRTVTSGLGSADLGGAWTTSPTANYSVAGGTASVRMATAGSSQTAYLGSTTALSTDLTTIVALSKVPVGGTSGLYLDAIGRRVDVNQEYDGLVRFAPGGGVVLSIRKFNGSGTAVNLVSGTASGLTYTAGSKLNIRFQASGASPTTLRLKVWLSTVAEPTAWALTTTDSSAGIQAAGAVGLRTYLSSGTTNVPIVGSFTAFSAKPVG